MRLVSAPRSFRDPRLPLPGRTVWCRPPVLEQVRGSPRQPRCVYGTLGTVFNVESGDLLSRLVQAFSRLEIEALLTTGPHIGRHELPDAPARVQVEQFVPQHQVLARSRAVVCHGGSGTVIASLSLGVPVVLLPMGADQPDNADRCEELGVGVVLDPVSVEPDAIVAGMRTVMDDRPYAQAAARLASEAHGQPQLHEIADLHALLETGQA